MKSPKRKRKSYKFKTRNAVVTFTKDVPYFEANVQGFKVVVK